MNTESVKKSGLYLFLISFTFLSMWIIGFISLGFSEYIPSNIEKPMFLSLLYLLSLIFPAFGLIIFMNSIKSSSPRWRWGIPLLVSIILITLNRDNNIMSVVYETSFISKYDVISYILADNFFKYSVQIVFSLSMILFALSVPETKRDKTLLPFRISLFTLACVVIFTIVDVLVRYKYIGSVSVQNNFGGLYILGIFVFGLSMIWTAVNYDKETGQDNLDR